jgi:hypothetical protein
MSIIQNSLSDPRNIRLKKDIIDLIDKALHESKRKDIRKSDETTTKQQILILHYLGIIPKINLDNSKKATLIARLLNRNVQNIRENLTYVEAIKIEDSDIKTKSNLEEILALFNSLGLIEETKLIIRDLEKIDKIR